MTMFRPLAALATVALATSACSGEIMTSQLHRANSDSFFRYAASAGEMRTVVVGNPFPVSQATLDQIVTQAMEHNHNGPPTRFTTTPGPQAHANMRVVVAFDPPSTMDNVRVLCGDPAAIPTSHPSGDRLQATVGFCMDSDLFSSVNISMPKVASPSDPAFTHMIASAMWQLIPSRDPLSTGDSCNGLICS